MGAYLDKPKVEKEGEASGREGFLSYGVSAMQGWRIDMEDAHKVDLNVLKQDIAFAGVFDGHGGKRTSAEAAKGLLEFITKQNEFATAIKNPDAKFASIYKQGFFQFDEDLEQKNDDDQSGSTAVTAFITKNHIIVGNCGDSRAVLSRGGKALPMSEDHKPTLKSEQDRIENAGGVVTLRRVDGDLAVSRALGDFGYKQRKDLKAAEQKVSAEPDVKIEARSPKDEYLILACDGIWDVMENQECVDFVHAKVNEGCNNLEHLCEAVLNECLRKDSKDNMSVCIIAFPGAPKAPADKVAAYERKRQQEEAELQSSN